MDDPQVQEPVAANPESTVPAPADNTEDKIKALEAKIADQAKHLTGSKAEGIRLSNEKAELEAQIVLLQKQPPADDSDVELFKQYAQKAGIPTREELQRIQQAQYKTMQDEELSAFLEKCPEYKPENDPANEKWTALIAELQGYKAPVNPKDWGKLLAKAHKVIAPDNTLETGKALGMAQARLSEQPQGGSGGASTPKKKLTPEQQAIKDGFKQARPEYFE